MKFGIGMRNVKTGIAVSLCVLISRLLKLEYPFYAAIAAIISMESSLSNSLRVGKNRMMGTFVGALAGLLFASIWPGSVLLSGIGIIIVIYICNLFKWSKSASIACVVFMVIMVNIGDRSPLMYSVNRLIDTFIGIVIALLVNYLIFPYNRVSGIIKQFNALSQKVLNTIGQVICLGINTDISSLNREIVAMIEQLDIYAAEFKVKKVMNVHKENIKNELILYGNIYSLLKTIQGLEASVNLNSDNIEKLKSFNFHDFKTNGYSVSNLNVVYNYLVEKIIRNLQDSKELLHISNTGNGNNRY